MNTNCSRGSCNHPIEHHYKNGCNHPECKCTRTFGATTLPEDNVPKQYKDSSMYSYPHEDYN